MYKVSVKRYNNSRWQTIEHFESFGNASYSAYDLQKSMEDGVITACKVEWQQSRKGGAL